MVAAAAGAAAWRCQRQQGSGGGLRGAAARQLCFSLAEAAVAVAAVAVLRRWWM